MERAVQVVNGRRDHVGKRPAVPENRSELLNTLVAVCVKWERFCAAAAESVPDELKNAVDRATKAVGKVKRVAGEMTPLVDLSHAGRGRPR